MVVEEVGYDEIECEGCVGRLFLFCPLQSLVNLVIVIKGREG